MKPEAKAKRDYDTTEKRFDAVTVKNLVEPGRHHDGGGLYFQITKSGGKSWLFRYTIHGKARERGLGGYPEISLSEAREKAAECRRMLREGQDPIAVKEAVRQAAAVESAKALTFDECRDAYLAAHESGWKNSKHRDQWRNTLTQYASPVFGALPVAAVDTSLVIKAIGDIWKAKPETASRVRGRVESVLSWATVRGYRSGANPAQWRGHLDQLLPKRSKVKAVEHHAALPHAAMHDFMVELRSHQADSVAAIALEACILTATRTSEVLNAEWKEFNLNRAEWVVPASRMKAGREHRVPLAPRVVDLLKSVLAVNNGPFPFSDNPNRPLSNMAMLALLRRMGRKDITVHGMRSTFRDWAAERTNFPSDVVEAALAHTVKDRVKAAYMRTEFFDQRRKLMEAWSRYIETPVKADNVIGIKGKAAT